MKFCKPLGWSCMFRVAANARLDRTAMTMSIVKCAFV